MADLSVIDSIGSMARRYRANTGYEPVGAVLGDDLLKRLAAETFGTIKTWRGTAQQWEEHIMASAQAEELYLHGLLITRAAPNG